MSINWTSDAEPAPKILVLPPDAESLDEAHDAIRLWEHYSGKRLDPTQRLTVEVMMATDSRGRWAASTTGREMPRQQGKGDEIEVVELWGLVQRAEAILHTIHDAVLLATQTQQRMLSVLGSHPDLRRKIKRQWTGTGQQMIEMRNGGTIWYRTRTGGGGRGVDDVDRLVIDEAQHVTSEQLTATTPTGFANANTQLNMMGTAALPGKSAAWWRIRKRALSTDPGRFGYVGHTAETLSLDDEGRVRSEIPDNVDDVDLWSSVSPGLRRRGDDGVEFLSEQLRTLGPEGFAQEHLCVWAPEAADEDAERPISLERWDSLAVSPDAATYDRSTARLAVVVALDRSWTTIALVARNSQGFAMSRLAAGKAGTQWAPERAKELADELGTKSIAVKAGEPLADDLERLGVEVVDVSNADAAKSTQKLIDACSADAPTFRHQGEPNLRKAVEIAETKPYGSSGQVWAPRNVSADISPLEAITLALGRLDVTAAADGVFVATVLGGS